MWLRGVFQSERGEEEEIVVERAGEGVLDQIGIKVQFEVEVQI